MEVKNTKKGFNMHQGLYIEKILEKFNMSDCSPVPTPYVEGHGTGKELPNKKYPYREAIGSLIYLSNGTRPDIAYAVAN